MRNCTKIATAVMTAAIIVLQATTAVLAQSEGFPDAQEVFGTLARNGGSHPEISGGAVNRLRNISAEEKTNADNIDIVPERSLFVRHPDLLAQISFLDVMAALKIDPGKQLADADDPRKAATRLFKQWMAMANLPEKKRAETLGYTCKENRIYPANRPYVCQRSHYKLAERDDVFGSPANGNIPLLIPVAAVNRFDLGINQDLQKPKTSCGEYRLIFQLNPDFPNLSQAIVQKFSVIFEASIPRGRQETGKCQAILKFWHSLGSPEMTPAQVAANLRKFFLLGVTLNPDGVVVPENSPGATFTIRRAMNRENLDEVGAGQVRTNIKSWHLNADKWTSAWIMREFKFVSGNLYPVSVKSSLNTENFLKAGRCASENREDLKAYLADSQSALWKPGTFGFKLARKNDTKVDIDALLAFETRAIGEKTAAVACSWLYEDVFKSADDRAPDVFETVERFEAEMEEEGNPDKGYPTYATARRLGVLSCTGCHTTKRRTNLGKRKGTDSDVFWGGSFQFRHIVAESVLDDGSYKISPFLRYTALLFRESLMQSELAKGLPWQ